MKHKWGICVQEKITTRVKTEMKKVTYLKNKREIRQFNSGDKIITI